MIPYWESRTYSVVGPHSGAALIRPVGGLAGNRRIHRFNFLLPGNRFCVLLLLLLLSLLLVVVILSIRFLWPVVLLDGLHPFYLTFFNLLFIVVAV